MEKMMNRWMKIAYDEAVKGMLANDGGPFGAVIVQDGKVIATAHNKNTIPTIVKIIGISAIGLFIIPKIG
jgi:tRNA(Arg) A34 adenosine deaminase TadA